MKVFHGSYTEIKEVDLTNCLPQKDFGQGFYVTKYRHHAENWAKIIGAKHNTKGYVTEFEYTESPFAQSICNIKHFEEYNEEWLDFVVANRNNKEPNPVHNYDIVEGPVADDKIQNRIRFYLMGKISKLDFLKELTYHEKTHQICFCTQTSLQLLENIEHISNINYSIIKTGERIVERLMIDLQIDETKAADLFYSSAIFGELANEETELYKETWQTIYQILKEELE